MTREQFENNTNWKMTFEEFQKCDCTQSEKSITASISTILS